MARSLVLLVVTLLVIIQVCTGLDLKDGIYEIRHGKYLLSDNESEPNTFARLMFPKRNQEAQQQWRVSREENDRVTIRNKKSNLYLSFQGKIFLGQFLSLTQEKRPWKLSSPFGAKYSIESVEEYLGTRLTANKSPPRGGTHLVMLDYPDKTQDPEWSFKLIEETYEQPRQYRLPYEKARGCH